MKGFLKYGLKSNYNKYDTVTYKCWNLDGVDFFNATAVPTMSNTSAFSVPAYATDHLIILVPRALYEDWCVATNWSTYALKIFVKDENEIPYLPYDATLPGIRVDNGDDDFPGYSTVEVELDPDDTTKATSVIIGGDFEVELNEDGKTGYVQINNNYLNYYFWCSDASDPTTFRLYRVEDLT